MGGNKIVNKWLRGDTASPYPLLRTGELADAIDAALAAARAEERAKIEEELLLCEQKLRFARSLNDIGDSEIAQMAGEVCCKLGINAPGEDAVKNWASVLEAIESLRSENELLREAASTMAQVREEEREAIIKLVGPETGVAAAIRARRTP